MLLFGDPLLALPYLKNKMECKMLLDIKLLDVELSCILRGVITALKNNHLLSTLSQNMCEGDNCYNRVMFPLVMNLLQENGSLDEDNEEDQEEMQEGEVVGGLGESEDGETEGVGSLQYTLQRLQRCLSELVPLQMSLNQYSIQNRTLAEELKQEAPKLAADKTKLAQLESSICVKIKELLSMSLTEKITKRWLSQSYSVGGAYQSTTSRNGTHAKAHSSSKKRKTRHATQGTTIDGAPMVSSLSPVLQLYQSSPSAIGSTSTRPSVPPSANKPDLDILTKENSQNSVD
jgi:hypothetical protein